MFIAVSYIIGRALLRSAMMRPNPPYRSCGARIIKTRLGYKHSAPPEQRATESVCRHRIISLLEAQLG